MQTPEASPSMRVSAYEAHSTLNNHETVLASDLGRLALFKPENAAVSYTSRRQTENAQVHPLFSGSYQNEVYHPDFVGGYTSSESQTSIRRRPRNEESQSHVFRNADGQRQSFATEAPRIATPRSSQTLEVNTSQSADSSDDDEAFGSQHWAFIMKCMEDARKREDWKAAEGAARAGIDFLGPASAKYTNWQFHLAFYLLAQDKPVKALAVLNTTEPENETAQGQASLLFADAYHKLKDYAPAEAACKRAIKHFKKSKDHHETMFVAIRLMVQILNTQGKTVDRDFYKTLLPGGAEEANMDSATPAGGEASPMMIPNDGATSARPKARTSSSSSVVSNHRSGEYVQSQDLQEDPHHRNARRHTMPVVYGVEENWVPIRRKAVPSPYASVSSQSQQPTVQHRTAAPQFAQTWAHSTPGQSNTSSYPHTNRPQYEQYPK